MWPTSIWPALDQRQSRKPRNSFECWYMHWRCGLHRHNPFALLTTVAYALNQWQSRKPQNSFGCLDMGRLLTMMCCTYWHVKTLEIHFGAAILVGYWCCHAMGMWCTSTWHMDMLWISHKAKKKKNSEIDMIFDLISYPILSLYCKVRTSSLLIWFLTQFHIQFSPCILEFKQARYWYDPWLYFISNPNAVKQRLNTFLYVLCWLPLTKDEAMRRATAVRASSASL